MSRPILPVILLGGSGTRLWPVSRGTQPKQYHNLCGDGTMLQETVQRLHQSHGVLNQEILSPIIIGGARHETLTEAQLAEIGITPLAHLLEPFGRNTAPALAATALEAQKLAPDSLLLVLPADHHITDVAAFHQGIAKAHAAASSGYLTTFGIQPDRPETGYGYIKSGDALDALDGVRRVSQFVEKPVLADAQNYVSSGTYFWNSGMFLFDPNLAIEELNRHQPEMVPAVQRALDDGERSDHICRLDGAAFRACPEDSIDYAIMEKTADGAVVPVDIGWSDVGSFQTLWSLGPQDEYSNRTNGRTVTIDTTGSYIDARSRLVATMGVRDLVIVETEKSVLVADRNKISDLKALVKKIEAHDPAELD